ncbi:MAG: 4-hydroxy-tetrahydrodipicolinate reductase [Solobacterium sp.]|nr:4-hydroxy-tetrahydrodipicolinate reductase [Solobacterium sp.]
MKILIVGKGKMGKLIQEVALNKGHEVLGMVDATDLSLLNKMNEVDVLIDFSHRDNLEWIKEFMQEHHCALVYGTTGLEEKHNQILEEIAKSHPVFYSANFSYGIAVMQKVLQLATKLLAKDYDMELVEMHHNQKADAPSGTAKAILNILNENHEYEEVYGRNGLVGKRKKEIGIHSLRGGSEAGQHSVYYLGDNETITITHHASNRLIFVQGALKAAEYIVGQDAGMYGMSDLLEGVLDD